MSDSLKPDVFAVDWHTHRRHLEPQLGPCTGVIHVQEHQNAATTIFVRTLVEIWLKDDSEYADAVVVHIDPEDAEVITAEQIAAKVIKETGITPPVPDIPIPSANEAFSKNTAGRDLTVTGNTVNYHLIMDGLDQYRDSGAFGVLADGLETFLSTRRLILVFRSLHDVPEARRAALARDLWAKCLVRFQHSGVLIICAYDRWSSLLGDGSGFPPPAASTIDLLPGFPDVDWPGAIADVTKVSLEQGWHASEHEASVFADGYIRGIGSRSVGNLHNALHVYEASRSPREVLDPT